MQYFHILILALAVFLTSENSIAADSFKDCPQCPDMVVIPAGSFLIGSDQIGSESPRTRINIVNRFALGKYEVTFDQWAACYQSGGCKSNNTPSDHGWGRGKRPVIYVTWHQAQEFIDWLNSNVRGNPYHLPSEAEWEFAASSVQSGTRQTKYSWGNNINCSMANYGQHRGAACFVNLTDENKGTKTVGSYAPNQFGLYDMHGNVWEWIDDCWHYGYNKMPDQVRKTGKAWKKNNCIFRVIRGGSWLNNPDRLRIRNRSRLGAANKDFNFGFRVARSLPN